MTDHNQVVSFSNAICTVYSTDNVCRPNNNLKTQETEIQMLTNLKTLENSEKKLAELVFNNKKLLFVFFQFLMSPVNYTIVLFPHKF
jgi:DNA-directed RNA polymerase specialized sigma subunit